jgi:pimeloyl-ACP methyl ester carboxylesterase
MPRVHANGIEIEYEQEGDPAGRPLLLVNGLGGQLIGWSPELRAALVAAGFRVIRYDNRDVGRSTWFDEAPQPPAGRGVAETIGGLALPGALAPAYRLEDMADDAAGLLEALGIGAAHVFGVSMGGMISQALAIRHPERVLSLCSVMSTTGNRQVGQPTAAALETLLQAPEQEREARVAQAVEGFRVISSPGYPFDEERERARCELAYDRAYHPAGVVRQVVAIVAAPDRTPALAGVVAPTLVVHGADDPLVGVSGGEATAAAIAGSTLLVLPGMGHDMPVALVPAIVDAFVANADRAGDAAGAVA